jgi:hypothetical protein
VPGCLKWVNSALFEAASPLTAPEPRTWEANVRTTLKIIGLTTFTGFAALLFMSFMAYVGPLYERDDAAASPSAY